MSSFNRNPASSIITSAGGKLDAPSPGAGDPSPQGADATPRRNPLLVLWQRRWLVVGSLGLAMVGAIVYLTVATPIYESSASVLVEQNIPRIIANDPSGAAINSNLNYF